MKKVATGFTLIELIIVIILIGILSSFAISRFINQTSNARVAALQGLQGAILSSTAIAQAEYRAEGNSSTSTVTTINMDGQSVVVTTGTGRPAGAAGGIDTSLQTFSGFAVTFLTGVATFNFTTTIPNCRLTYTASTGAVALTTTGC